MTPAAPRACAHPVQRPDERGRPTCGKCGADLIAEQAPLQRGR